VKAVKLRYKSRIVHVVDGQGPRTRCGLTVDTEYARQAPHEGERWCGRCKPTPLARLRCGRRKAR